MIFMINEEAIVVTILVHSSSYVETLFKQSICAVTAQVTGCVANQTKINVVQTAYCNPIEHIPGSCGTLLRVRYACPLRMPQSAKVTTCPACYPLTVWDRCSCGYTSYTRRTRSSLFLVASIGPESKRHYTMFVTLPNRFR
jgi:hypothetical protein